MPIFSPMTRRFHSKTRVGAALAAAVLLAAVARAGAAPKFTAGFALSPEDLVQITESLPADIQGVIRASPGDFLKLLAAVLDQPAEFFLLVDKHHPLGAAYVPPDLVRLEHYPVKVSWPHVLLRKDIMADVLAMASAARSDGVTLTFSSGYRSFGYQKGVFEREVEMYGLETAERESAHAGYSQHQLGTAIDFGTISDDYERTPEGRWVAAHAWQYGFSLSYPAGYEALTGYRHESWHYRYITRPGALMQRRYFRDIQQYFLQFLHDNRDRLVRARLR